MEKIEGGIVQHSFVFPAKANSLLVAGKWTDCDWQAGQEAYLTQFRYGTSQRQWRWTGYQTLSRIARQDSLLILTGLTPLTMPVLLMFKPGDILVSGERGKYSEFTLKTTNLPTKRNCAIELEVEKQRYKGIALYEQDKFSKLIVFHPKNLKLVPNEECVIWWRGKPFLAKLVVNKEVNKNKVANRNKTKKESIFARWESILVPVF